jgi:hypothetical protein
MTKTESVGGATDVIASIVVIACFELDHDLSLELMVRSSSAGPDRMMGEYHAELEARRRVEHTSELLEIRLPNDVETHDDEEGADPARKHGGVAGREQWRRVDQYKVCVRPKVVEHLPEPIAGEEIAGIPWKQEPRGEDFEHRLG